MIPSEPRRAVLVSPRLTGLAAGGEWRAAAPPRPPRRQPPPRPPAAARRRHHRHHHRRPRRTRTGRPRPTPRRPTPRSLATRPRSRRTRTTPRPRTADRDRDQRQGQVSCSTRPGRTRASPRSRRLSTRTFPVVLINAEIAKTGLAKAQIVSNNAQGATPAPRPGRRRWTTRAPTSSCSASPATTTLRCAPDGYKGVISQYPGLKQVGQGDRELGPPDGPGQDGGPAVARTPTSRGHRRQ